MRAGLLASRGFGSLIVAALFLALQSQDIARQDASALFARPLAAVLVPVATEAARGDAVSARTHAVFALGARFSDGRVLALAEEGRLVGSTIGVAESAPAPRVNRAAKADLPLTIVPRREPPEETQAARVAAENWFAVAFGDATVVGPGEFSRALPPIVVPGEGVTAQAPRLDLPEEAPPTLAFAPLPHARPETSAQAFERLRQISIRGSADLERAHRCLAEAIYFEARGESERGQQAVAQVVINRARSGHYPSDICDVIYQNRHWRNRCQFSYACDGRPEVIHDRRAWETASRIADDALSGRVFLADIGDSTHYHATYVAPRWRRGLDRTRRVGTHIFYRMPGVEINGS